MATPHLPILLDIVTDAPERVALQNRDNIDRLYAYLQGLISDIEEQNTLNAEALAEAQTSIDAEYIVATPDASLNNERVVTNSPTLTWDVTTPGQLKAHVSIAPSLPLTGVRVENDQDIAVLTNVTDMSFPVVAGRYYNIRFAIIAHSNTVPGDVAFRVTTPPTHAYAALGVS